MEAINESSTLSIIAFQFNFLFWGLIVMTLLNVFFSWSAPAPEQLASMNISQHTVASIFYLLSAN